MTNSYLVSFSLFIFILGIILTYFTFNLQSELSNKCVSHKVQHGLNIILMLSLMMVVIPLIQLYCHSYCNCPQINLWYRKIVIFLSLSLAVTGGVVWNGLNNEVDCDSSDAKSFIYTLVLSGSVLFGLLVFGPYIPYLKNIVGNGNSNDITSWKGEQSSDSGNKNIAYWKGEHEQSSDLSDFEEL